MLGLTTVTKDYKVADTVVHALKGVSLYFRKNEFVSILGPSGCGKTTMLNIIGGLDKYTSGDVSINGVSTRKFRDGDWDVYRNHRIGFIFQSYNLIPHQTVLGNVELALTIAGVGKAERVERAKKALDRVGLSGQYYKRPNQLSGGQCQRVAIARALAIHPELLICDEATGALDVSIQNQIAKLLVELVREQNMGCIFIGHDLALVRSVTQRMDSEDLEVSCRHPYTRALLNSVFDVYCDQNEEIQLLQGEPPSPLQMPEGCPFAPRCPKCTEECRRQIPVLRTIEDGHDVACHYAT